MGANLGSLLYYIKMNNADIKAKLNETTTSIKKIGNTFAENAKVIKDWGNAFTIATKEMTKDFAKIVTENRQAIQAAKDREKAEQQAAQKAVAALKEQEKAERQAAQAAKEAAEQTKQGWQTVGIVTGAIFTAMILGIRDVTKEFINLTNSLLGLMSVSRSFNQDAGAATKAAQELASDGLMNVADAAASLKNLLASGFDLPQAIALMKRFKDIASFNRQASLGFGQAIRGATEGIKNGNSILVDNIGLTKNLSMIMKEAGFAETDVMRVTSDLNVRMAMFKGLLKETNPYIGDAAKLAGTLGGQMQKSATAASLAKAAFGEALNPVLATVYKRLTDVWNIAKSLAEAFPELTAAVTAFTMALTAMLTVLAAIKAVEIAAKIKAVSMALNVLKGPIGWIMLVISLGTAAYTAWKTATDRAREAQQKLANTATTEYTTLKKLIDQYNELSKKTSKTAQEKKTLHELGEKIAKLSPDLVKGYDSEKNAIIDISKAQQLLNEKMEKALELRRKINREEINAFRADILKLQQQRDSLVSQQNMELFGGRKSTADQDKYLAQKIRAENPNRTYTKAEMKKTIKQYRENYGASVGEIDKLISSAQTRLNDLVRQGGRLPSETTITTTTKPGGGETKKRTPSDVVKDWQEQMTENQHLLELQGKAFDKTAADAEAYKSAILDMYKVDPGNAKIAAWSAEYQKLAQQIKKNKNAQTVADIYQKLSDGLKKADDQAKVFENQSEANSQKVNALETAIMALLTNGIDPAQSKMGNLIQQYKDATNAVKDYERALSDARDWAQINLEKQQGSLDDQIQSLEHQKELAGLDVDEIRSKTIVMQIEQQINKLKMSRIDLEIEDLNTQMEATTDLKEKARLENEINNRRRERKGLEDENVIIAKTPIIDDYARILYDETRDSVASGIEAAFDDGGIKSGWEALWNSLANNMKRKLVDALTDAVMNSAFGQSLQSGTNSISNFISSLFGGTKTNTGTGTNTAANTGSGGTETSTNTGTGLFASLSNYLKTNKTAGTIASIGASTLLGSAAGGNNSGATTGAMLGSLLGSIIPGLGTALGGMAGGLLGGLFGGGSDTTMSIQANSAKMDIDFASANFKTVALPKTYMSSQSGTTKNTNSVAPVVNINVAGNVVTERDLQKTMTETANEVYSARKVAGKKWSEATVNGVDINDY